MTGTMETRHQGWCQVPPNKSLRSPQDASVTALAFVTAAPDAGASELKR